MDGINQSMVGLVSENLMLMSNTGSKESTSHYSVKARVFLAKCGGCRLVVSKVPINMVVFREVYRLGCSLSVDR